MFRRTSPPLRGRDPRRRGAILLVVLTMLALFAVIGLSFVLYAESEANASRISKDAVNTDLNPPDTTAAINAFLEGLIFQPDKPESALYGNELSRLMYGNAQLAGDRTTAYNGLGVYAETLNPKFNGVPVPLHRTQFVRFGNYFYNPLVPSQYVRVHPDQTYADPSGYVEDGVTALPMGATLKYVGRNASYTYPDRNNIYLAVQDPATGRIVKPSYHAPSLFGSLDPSNLNWYRPQGYFQLLRPRTVDNLTTEEMNYLAGLSPALWPIPTNFSSASAATLFNILSGNDTAAPVSFKRAFPFVAPNPGGSFTGDVQNVKYGEGQQTADSVWLDAKLPIVTYRGTRRLQPMIAATVLPLEGRVNTNVAGNLANGGNHGSHQGFGPAEVNLLKILQAADPTTPNPTYTTMMNRRYNGAAVPVPSGASSNYYFHPDPTATAVYPPSYSPVDFGGLGTAQPTAPAAPTAFATSYTYPPATFNSSSTSAPSAYVLPPLLFNPFQWNPYTTSGGTGNQFPLGDERYLAARYSDKAKNARNSTYLGQAITTPNPIGYASSSPGHPMNRARALLTPISNRLARPGLAPMAVGNTDTNNMNAPALVLNAGVLTLANPRFDLAVAANNPLTSATAPAVGGDYTTSPTAIAANVRAILQGVDLNRPLADYRDPLTRPAAPVPPATAQDWPFVPGPNAAMPGMMPTAPTTVTPDSCARANFDRQALATDIFNRLCVALNARVYYPGTAPAVLNLPQLGGTPGPYTLTGGAGSWNVTQPEYDALRWIAQLSANIVDAIDPDDVSTPFVWNPIASANPTDPANFATGASSVINDRVVFGVEKPKLLVNEAYAEMANEEKDYAADTVAAGGKFTVRFFVELLNPSNAEAVADQNARNGGNASLQFPGISCYRLEVYEDGKTTHDQLADTTNSNYVLGLPPTTNASKLTCNFTAGVNCNAGVTFKEKVEPNEGQPTATAGNRYGFCVVGPALDPTKPENTATAYAPQTTTAGSLDQLMLLKTPQGMKDQLEYTVPATKPEDIAMMAVKPLNDTKLHAVLLQRLANPYLAESPTNPYITVDYMAGVEVFDAVRIGLDSGATKGARMPAQDASKNYSMGRAQPYTGYQSPAAMTAPVTTLNVGTIGAPPLATTLTVLQDPQPPPAATVPRNTFFRHNSRDNPAVLPFPSPANPAETLVHPFREPFQPDRRLINPLEILHVSMAPSHLLTRNFATPNGATPNFYQQELFRAVLPTPAPAVPSVLYRALEVLNVKPWTYGVPHGGRTPGGVNINAIWDEAPGTGTPGESAVFNALLDPQGANTFVAGTSGTPGNVAAIWQGLRFSRSPGWTGTTPGVGATVDEVVDASINPPTFGTDRPFKGFGVGQYDTTMGGGLANAQGLESTLLRSASPPNGTPLFFNPTPSFGATDPYFQMEPLRKAFNNLTTVSDNFLVVFTVGFFEVVETPGRVILRREAYEQVPGDLRTQYTAVIDRSGLAVDPNNLGGGQTGKFAQVAAATGVETLIPRVAGVTTFNRYRVRFPADSTSTATEIKVRDMPTANGSVFTVKAGSTIRLGSGPTAANFDVTELGGVFTFGGVPADARDVPAANAYDAATGLATVTFEVQVDAMGNPAIPGQRLPVCHTGDLISLPDNEVNAGNKTVFIPGNPGRVQISSPTDPRIRGVVRYFGKMQP